MLQTETFVAYCNIILLKNAREVILPKSLGTLEAFSVTGGNQKKPFRKVKVYRIPTTSYGLKIADRKVCDQR